MLGLLARSGTGQALCVYTNIVTGPRRVDDVDGPEELHVVVLDNGRSGILGTEFQEALHCVRCGACLNVCPVYRQVGGHAYGSVYAGPIGAVLTPLLQPEEPQAQELAEASTLCGACWEACPVRIPLHDLLLQLRRRDAGPRPRGWCAGLGFASWSWLWSTRPGFVLTTGLGEGRPPAGPGPPPAAGLGRRLGRGARAPVTDKGALLGTLRSALASGTPAPHRPFAIVATPPEVAPIWPDPSASMPDRWTTAFEALGGHVHRTAESGLGAAVAEALAGRGPVLVDHRFARRIFEDSFGRGPVARMACVRAGGRGRRPVWGARRHRGGGRDRQRRDRHLPQRKAGQPVAPGRRLRGPGVDGRAVGRRCPASARRALA